MTTPEGTTNMSKHTPGPWRWTRGNLKSIDGSDIIDAGDVCVGAHDESDARLLAAAPDLLAACMVAHRDLHPFGDASGDEKSGAVDALRAAIEKALGSEDGA